MKVIITTKKWGYIPTGSMIKVTRVNKNSYRGIWGSAMGTYYVTVPKTHVLTYYAYLRKEGKYVL
jgi:hypothetical protein